MYYERENRFMENFSNSGSHREHSATKLKEIYAHNNLTEEEKPILIRMDKTVKDLKKEIEKVFKLNYSLDEIPLKVKNSGQKAPKPILEEEENKTLFQIHIKSECIVFFGREKYLSGK